MSGISLALVWHQHQPYYPDPRAEKQLMPWVRLHGTKDYWGMAMHLKEVPEFRATINLVPSLLSQIRAYTEEGFEDEHLRISRLPAGDLTEHDLHFLMDHFFMVHPEHNIRPFPRYLELFLQRGMGVDSAARAAKRFSQQDVIDLQCWSNLVWIHGLAFEQDPDLAEFRDQGRGWTEDEKQWLIERQLELLKEVIPLHAELAASGQVELTTTPFYHPILPLLWDKQLARHAMPEVHLPQQLEGYPEDGIAQIQKAIDYHEEVFGMRPVGMWPSEGSVCQAMIPAVSAAGIRWLATDEEILSCSTNGWVSRDPHGFMKNPEMLYRPWQLQEQGAELQIVFRDHAMSDQIGFHYQRFQPAHAIDDFLGKLDAISHATGSKTGHRPPLVTIVLDGENCWEYYPDGGVSFLRGLYQRVARESRFHSTTVQDFLEKYPATDRIDHLFAGSWISHNFGIWIGHPECNTAWDLLYRTREDLLAFSDSESKSAEQLEKAWEELYIAEGSDWFWWFGDSHSSAQDALFDHLFRCHLQNVYLALDEPPPADLSKPISGGHLHHDPVVQPSGLLNVKVDGRRTYFEWLNAGRYATTGHRGTMSQATKSRLQALLFGFDENSLFIRMDTAGLPAREGFADIDRLRLFFNEPEGFEILIAHPSWSEPLVQLYHNDVPVSESGVEVAADMIFELSVPWETLAVAVGDRLAFACEFIQGDAVAERVPSEGFVESAVPSADFELLMWQA